MKRKQAKKWKKVWKSEQEKLRWLASPKGQAWVEEQIAKRNAARPDPGPPPERLTRTKYPFTAIINGISKEIKPDREEQHG